MTHIENIPHILEKGITHQYSVNSNKNYVPIGANGIILKRENVILQNGNKLGNYIPFYFGPRMPMLYVIMLGSHSVSYNMKHISSEDIIYCITSVEEVRKLNVDFLFSNGHAVSDLTDFFDSADVENILNIIDETAITARYWRDDNDLDLKRRKEAEFLVLGDIPSSSILGFAVYNEKTKHKLIEFGIDKKQIVIRPNYYF